MVRAAAVGAVCCALGLTMSGRAQELPPNDAWVAVAPDRQVLVLPAAAESPGPMPAPDGRPFSARTHEANGMRVHVVEFGGETFRAVTPLEGPYSRIVFDPSRRAFAQLLPSVRVEFPGGAQLEAIARALGATNVTVFDRLGFAFLELPANLHPVEAVARVEALPGSPGATVRMRPPKLQWR